MEDIHRLASSLRWKLLHRSCQPPEHDGNERDTSHDHVGDVPPVPDITDATKELVMKLSKAQGEIQRLHSENKELLKKNEQRSTQLHMKNNELNALREELRQLKAEKAHLQRLHESVGQDTKKDDYLLTLLRSEIQLLKTSLDSVVEDHHSSREEHSKLCSLHDEAVKRITAMRDELEMKSEALLASKSCTEKMEQLLREGEQERQGLLASVALLSIRLNDQEDRVDKADKVVLFMEEQSVAYQRQLDDLKAQISELEQQKNLSTEALIKLQEAYELADSNNQQLLHDKEKEIAALQCRLIELASNVPLSSTNDTLPTIPLRERTAEPAVTSPSPITTPVAAVIDASPDCNCAICSEPPYGVMIVCESCQREHHSSCAKRSGILRGELYTSAIMHLVADFTNDV